MTSSNINNYVSKNYLNVFKIVPVKMESIQSFIDIAIALNGVFNLACFHLHIVE